MSRITSVVLVAAPALVASYQKKAEEAAETSDPAEVAAGERLFLETRFAQFFFANAGGDLNAVLAAGGPVMDDTVGLFKTPALRDLGQSAPYFHTGQKDATEDVIRHYIAFSALARSGNVPNAATELRGVAILEADLDALRALNEDYQ